MNPQDPFRAALNRARDEIGRATVAPSPAEVRARAERQQRIRRSSLAAVAGAAVVALALGGTQALSMLTMEKTGPIAPPTFTPTPTPLPTDVTPAPQPTDTGPTLAPSLLPVATAEPVTRPAPVRPPDVTDPIADVDWYNAVINIPEHDRCPSGAVEFSGVDTGEVDPVARAQPPGSQITIDLRPRWIYRSHYGDLTGDGAVEVVLEIDCYEELASGHEGELLVVTRTPDGELVGSWPDTRGATHVTAFWVADEGLHIEAQPWTGEYQSSPSIPGKVWRYPWDGTGFSEPELSPEYPLVAVAGSDDVQARLRLGPVATALGCPDVDFSFFPTGGNAIAVMTDSTMIRTSPIHGLERRLFDLDGTGDRLLVMALACERPREDVRYAVGVFEVVDGQWHGISGVSLVTIPESEGSTLDIPVYWRYGDPVSDLVVGDDHFVWDGTVLHDTGADPPSG